MQILSTISARRAIRLHLKGWWESLGERESRRYYYFCQPSITTTNTTTTTNNNNFLATTWSSAINIRAFKTDLPLGRTQGTAQILCFTPAGLVGYPLLFATRRDSNLIFFFFHFAISFSHGECFWPQIFFYFENFFEIDFSKK